MKSKSKRRYTVVCGSCGEGLERGDGGWWHIDEDSPCQTINPQFNTYETNLSVGG